MVTVTKHSTYQSPRYGVSTRVLPKSLSAAAGMLKHKRKALEKHLATVRKEWK